MGKIKVGLIGYGNVGRGFAEYFYNSGNPELDSFSLSAIGIKDIKKERNFPSTFVTTNSLDDIVRKSDIKIIIDGVGGDAESNKCSLKYIEEALKHGKHVITANKHNLSRNFYRLVKMAEDNKVNLEYEASVCGCIPVIQTMREYYTNDCIKKIVGIVNGTSNYILTEMHKGMSFNDALSEAKIRGYAEADHFADISGEDSADKIAILANIAFRMPINPENISIEGIDHIDPDMFFYVRDNLKLRTNKYHTIKSLAIAEMKEGKLDLRVHPAYIREDHPLYGVNGVLNAICIVGEYGNINVLKGPGAGSIPTGFAVASDLIKVGRKIQRGIIDNFLPRFNGDNKDIDQILLGNNRVTSGFIKSCSLEHKTGVLAQKSNILANRGISIRDWFNFVERETDDLQEIIPDIFLIEASPENLIYSAVNELSKEDVCRSSRVTYLREDSVYFKTK